MADSGIVSKIIETARAKGQKLLADARATHDANLAKGTAALNAQFGEKRDSMRRHRQEAAQQTVSAFRLTERNETHVFRRSLIDEVYAEAWKKLLEPARYRKLLEKRLDQHCREGDQIVVSSSQRELFAGELKDILSRRKLVLSTEQGGFRAGFIAARGSVRLNCTLDEEMKDAIRDRETEVARVLFGK